MSTRRLVPGLCVSVLLALLTACPESTPTQDSAAPSPQPAASAGPDDPQSATDKQTGHDATQPRRRMRTGGPLPPRRMPEPVELDRSCSTDADCTVKDVGSCCGPHPACVNVDSPADPEAVRAECARRGESSACDVREISDCRCVQGSCKTQIQAIDPPIDPAPRVPETR